MLIYLILLICLMAVKAQELGPVLTISQGNLVGSIANDGDYWMFLGIPYASSAAGENRFKAPQDAANFEEIFFANKKGIKCVQATQDGFEGTEDCLVLNIFTPTIAADENELLPVIVWAQGEELDYQKHEDISFKQLVEQNVVVVSLNYRQSVFGFLCLGIEDAPGNAGLKDIIAGLKWIKKNIESFGGNPENINLLGHGTSAAAVDLVSLSPLADGLIHKVITQSGNGITPWSLKYDPRVNARSIVEKLGHDINSNEDIVEILKRTSVAAIMGVLKDFDLTDDSLVFGPCLENPDLNDEDHILIESPLSLLEEGNYNPLPYLTGFVSDEGTVKSREAISSKWLERMENNFEDFLQSDLEFNDFSKRLSVANSIKKYYFQSNEIDVHSIQSYFDYHGDTMITVPVIRNAWIRASSSSEHVFLYQFSYNGAYGNSGSTKNNYVSGAEHGGELGYLFDLKTSSIPTTQDEFMKNIMIERWTNFVKTGSPFSSLENATVWTPVEFDNINYLHMTNSDSSDSLPKEIALVSPQASKMTFWDKIYERYSRQVTSVFVETRIDDEDDDLENSTITDENNDSTNNETDEEEVYIPETVTLPDINEDMFSSGERHIAAILTVLGILLFNILHH